MWEFPKGKKNFGETDIECAVRECYEETTLQSTDYYIYPNLKLFKGNNDEKKLMEEDVNQY